jgi:hypothetical protein
MIERERRRLKGRRAAAVMAERNGEENTKHQTPNTNNQTPNSNYQTPNTKARTPDAV